MQLVSKTSNPCGPDGPTFQMDGRTDDMQSQDCALHHSTSCGKTERQNTGIADTISIADTVSKEYRYLIN